MHISNLETVMCMRYQMYHNGQSKYATIDRLQNAQQPISTLARVMEIWEIQRTISPRLEKYCTQARQAHECWPAPFTGVQQEPHVNTLGTPKEQGVNP